MKVKVTYHDGPRPMEVKAAEDTKAIADKLAITAKAQPQNAAIQKAHTEADARAKEAADAANVPMLAGLREAVKGVADRHSSNLVIVDDYKHLIECGSEGIAKAIMNDPELNTLGPIQIETVA